MFKKIKIWQLLIISLVIVVLSNINLIYARVNNPGFVSIADSPLLVTLATALDKTNDSITNYPASSVSTTVDLATDADVVVTASPAILLGYRVDTVMSGHVALIKDSATTKLTVGSSTVANYNENCYNSLFSTNITVESDNAATGKLTLFWRAL